MTMSDPLGDMLTRIRNAQMRKKTKVTTPGSRLRERVLDVLQAEGYIRGYSQVEGKGVADNNRIEAGAGMSYAFFRRPDEELTSGLDLVYLSYDKNLRFFTLGQGGYFSPQNYVAANIPIDYRARVGNLSYHLGGQIGLAHFKEDRTPLFPNDPALQARAEARAAADSTQSAYYSGQTQTSLVGGVRADAEYAITPQFKVGGLLRYDRAADWNEVRAMLFARYRFD